MAVLTLSVFTITWAVLIIAIVVCGVWVFLAIRRSFTPVLIFDLTYLFMLEALCLSTLASPANAAETAFYLITLVTFLLNSALTFVILYEWGDRPTRMNQYVWWLKIALSITGVYTVIPLALYYLKLYYLPPRTGRKGTAGQVISEADEDEIPGLVSLKDVPEAVAIPPAMAERYRDRQLIGWGGFARVFSATKADGTKVAVKLPLLHDEAVGKMFISELTNWTEMECENIVKVIDFNILPVPFIEMELCDSSLAALKKPLDPAVAAWLMHGVASGLVYSHGRKVIHQDLKPSNILLCNGVPKISDWGLSRVVLESPVASPQAAFTPQYAAPEQVLRTVKDGRTDIWQAGAIFYELVTAQLPFAGENINEILSGIIGREPVPPSSLAPPAKGLDGIILQCLAKNPDGRFSDAAAFRAAIAEYLQREHTARLAAAIAGRDTAGAARSCSSLLLLSLYQEDFTSGYRYASELVNYAGWRRRGAVHELMRRIGDAIAGEGDAAEILARARDIAREIGEAGA
ncbi:MAG: serine/threonine-protein kinase [Methanoregula sp. PtaU1.Bin051]|nr:MAG: serine/threonine-protein kinase [Methanoregula sp. PtaU1.Bin051]